MAAYNFRKSRENWPFLLLFPSVRTPLKQETGLNWRSSTLNLTCLSGKGEEKGEGRVCTSLIERSHFGSQKQWKISRKFSNSHTHSLPYQIPSNLCSFILRSALKWIFERPGEKKSPQKWISDKHTFLDQIQKHGTFTSTPTWISSIFLGFKSGIRGLVTFKEQKRRGFSFVIGLSVRTYVFAHVKGNETRI